MDVKKLLKEIKELMNVLNKNVVNIEKNSLLDNKKTKTFLKHSFNLRIVFKNKFKVILDTNSLLIPGQFKVDIFSEIKRIMDVPYELYIIDRTIEELNKITVLGKQKDVMAAKLGTALVGSLIKQKSLKKIVSSQKTSVDDSIVEKSNKKIFVATQDRELKQRVKEKGARIITLKQKKYLAIE